MLNSSDTHATADSGLLALIAAITMLFAAFSSAYIVRRGLANGWTPLALPPIVLVSPIALILARGRAALPFGAIAILVIIETWRELALSGVSAASNAGAAFFFIFSGGFVLSAIAGMAALVVQRNSRSARLFWIYLAGLWCWLLLLLEVWR